jgi:predicted esterase
VIRPALITAGLALVGGVLRHVLQRRQLPEMTEASGLAAREGAGNAKDPLIVFLHGPGGYPGQLERWVAPPVGPFVSFRGVHEYRGGYQWLTSRLQQTPAPAFLAEAEGVAQQLAAAIEDKRTHFGVTRSVVVGHSQGGHLAWLLAAMGVVDGAVIASGALPESFTPPKPTRPIEIAALAGTEDKTVPWPLVDSTRARFVAAGYAATATQVKGGHALQAIGPHLGPALVDVLARMAVHEP